MALFPQLIRRKFLIRRSIGRGGAIPPGGLSSSLLRQYPKWPTGNPGVVRRMQIPEESDAAAELKGSEPKGPEPKGPESKGKGSKKHSRLASAEHDASLTAQRLTREQ